MLVEELSKDDGQVREVGLFYILDSVDDDQSRH